MKVLLQLCILACFVSSLYAIKSGLRGTYGSFYLVNANSDKCLNVYGAIMASGTGLIQWSCVNADNNKWQLEPTLDGAFVISSIQNTSFAASARAFAAPQVTIQWKSLSAKTQGWNLQLYSGPIIGPPGQLLFTVQNVMFGEYLEVEGAVLTEGAKVVTNSASSSGFTKNQLWYLVPA